MILVTVGDDATLDPVGIFPQVAEVGQHQVDPGHLDVGEHQPAVEDHDPPVDLEAGAVAADLAQAAQEDDPDRVAQPRSWERTSRARVLEPLGSRTERQPALTGGQPQRPQHGFGGDRVGGLVA